MLARSWPKEADVLLPFAMSKATAEGFGYPHFKKNRALLDSIGIADENRFWSLVCVGRYSTRFILKMYHEYWLPGAR